MVELILKFKDPNGEDREISVGETQFIIGRHSECDLSISDGRLSREHLLIERYGDVFVVTDRGSSNGSILNDESIAEPKAIKNGDRLALGGFEIEILILDGESDGLNPPEAEQTPAPVTVSPQSNTASQETGIPKSLFVVTPILGLIVLVALGSIIYFTGGKENIKNNNFVYSNDPEETPKILKTPEPGGSPTVSSDVNTAPNGTNTSDSGNVAIAVPTPNNLSDAGKTEANAAAFLRKAAANDPKAFVTGAQAQIIYAKIRSVAASPTLAENISSARKNAAAIKTLATAKNLKPQFLAIAAITKLGSSRGDVLSTAQTMADDLDQLAIQIGNELGEDCLLMMAAYNLGDPIKMRNMLQDLATKSSESSRTVRTIWFLQKNGKITPAEFDLALRFLAIGTIAQNPRDFGVNTDGLTF